MKQLLCSLMLVVVGVAGCSDTPAAKYLRAEKSLTATIKSFTVITTQLDDEQIKVADSLFTLSSSYLDEWHDALDANEPYLDFEENFNWAVGSIRNLVEVKEKK